MNTPEGAGDMDDLLSYEAAVKPLEPAMLSFYVAPTRTQMSHFVDRYRRLSAIRPFFVAQIGLYFQSLQTQVAAGQCDIELKQLANCLRDTRLPVLLRVGYEFDSPWAPYDPKLYISGFRRITMLLRQAGATNVATVWDATAAEMRGREYMKWYPGDTVVDWWGINLFETYDFALPAVAYFMDDARQHSKPVLIGETSPVFRSWLPWRVHGASSERESLEWLSALFAFIRKRPEVQAVSIISVDWRRLHSTLPGFGWPDTRIADSPSMCYALRHYLANPRFIHESEASTVFAPRQAERAHTLAKLRKDPK
ncbi:MAG: glycoside hydrolase family 26 protein [Candidatus Binataceae bacterium]